MAWLDSLKNGLSKSSSQLGDGISAIFNKRKIDEETLAELEDLLIAADLGPKTSAEIIEDFSKEKFGKEISAEEIKEELAKKISALLEPYAKELVIDKNMRPEVIMLVGVNGNGKTTTLGKLALKFKDSGNKVMIAACDTFRAAAAEQLEVWAKRADAPVIKGNPGQDPASVGYTAYEKARKEGYDVLLIDTAGRLQNKTGLMEELAKIIKTLRKIDEKAPHKVILVLDATTGQNALSQAKEFKEKAHINGLIVTKLDGTAKGGIVANLARNFALPVYAVGVGESVADLNHFDPLDFAKNLVNL